MILSDNDLIQAIGLGTLVVSPFDTNRVQPASIDLTLGDEFADWGTSGHTINLAEASEDSAPPMIKECYPDGFRLRPGAFALATTVETIGLDASYSARVEGRSSLGRLGLCIHATAGFIDPGFKGQITLELFNMGPHTLLLVPGMSICQLAVSKMKTPSRKPYGAERGSKYQDQVGATPTRWRGSANESGDADH